MVRRTTSAFGYVAMPVKEEISFAYETFYVFHFSVQQWRTRDFGFISKQYSNIVDRFPTMHDDGHLEFLCDLQLRLENFALRIA